MIKLIDQTVKFVNRMRWRAHFFELQNFTTSSPHIDVYDELAGIYNSKRSAPEIKKLKAFEDELFNLIKNVKFNNFKSRFQKQLKHDTRKLLSKK